MLATASRYYAEQQRLSALAVKQLRRPGSLNDLLRLLAVYQSTAALLAMEHGTEALREQDIPDDGARLIPSAFTVTPSAPSVLDDVGPGFKFDRIISSLVSDAGRSAMGAFTASRDREVGNIRVLTPPSCSRCAILAGRFYRWSDGFQRHPKCFPAGTVVSGPGSLGASRRWYEGELLTLRTASGKQLSVTANHPILTRRGWVPAQLLIQGDEVISRASGDRTEGLLVPDEDQVPARIEDVWRSSRMSPLGRVPVSSEDFHGDGLGSSHVDVVLADGLLRSRAEASIFEEFRQAAFAYGLETAIALLVQRATFELREASLLASAGGMGGGDLSLASVDRRSACSQEARFAGVADRHLCFDEPASNYLSAYTDAQRDRVLALPTDVSGDDSNVVKQEAPTARWDAPSVPFSLENRTAYASIGLDLSRRLSGQVQADRIVKVERVGWSGHVYNLTSSEGWYDAEGIIVSNCDCAMLPASRGAALSDPFAAFERGEITDLTKAQTKAIEDGADISQVVNSTKGMQTASFAGRRVQITTEGTTSRGLAFRALSSRRTQRVEAGFATRITASGPETRRITQTVARAPRLSPEAIYNISGDDRQQAIRLLRANGYLL